MGLDSPLAGGAVSRSMPRAGLPVPSPQGTSVLQRLESPFTPASVFPYTEHPTSIMTLHFLSSHVLHARPARPRNSVLL